MTAKLYQLSDKDRMKVLRAAAVADSRALRLLPARVRCRPTDFDAAFADHEYLEARRRDTLRARRYRQQLKEQQHERAS